MCRRELWAALTLGILAATVSLSVAASGESFFPTPSPTVHLYSAKGVLVRYGVGADAGGFELKNADGYLMQFTVGRDMKVDGRRLGVCFSAPKYCDGWPQRIVLRRTEVTVTYWKISQGAWHGYASNRIDVAQ